MREKPERTIRRWLKRVVLAGLALIAIAQPVRPDACTGKPDGATCDAGADHSYALICAAGACVPCVPTETATPQFVDNGDGTITDRQTCLVWEKKDNAGGIHDLNNVYQWSSSGSAMDGSAFTVFLSALNGNGFAGHHDWRLPTSAGNGPATGQPAEVETIEASTACGPTQGACMPAIFNTNCGPYNGSDPPAASTSNPGCTVDGAAGTSSCSCAPFYHSWSGSTVNGASANAWLECYTVPANGLSSPSKTDTYNVRAVRGGAVPAVTCPTTPLTPCLLPGMATLLLSSHALDHHKDTLRWFWKQGSAVSAQDIGEPTAMTAYAVCIYANNALLMQATAPPGLLWHTLRGTPPAGYRYGDRAGSSDGITSIRVTSGAATKTRASATGRGMNLPFVTLPLAAGQLPVTVQLLNNNPAPQCWSATYSNPPVTNTSSRLRLRLP